MRKIWLTLFATSAFACLSTPSLAAKCGGDFNTFVANMSAEAAAAGVSRGVIDQALSGLTKIYVL